ncbi:CLOCK-interacting pacemaker isoform 2-T2 [Acanthopagrus schlegelii]
MPKEQPCSNEHSVCAPSSKNAKDKSNSTTLMAIRKNKDADSSRGRGSHCSSEKDSGYSDASDWQQTDVDDQRTNKSQSRGSELAETSQSGQNQEIGQGNSVNPTLMAAGHQLSPIYIMNNMVLKQDMIQKTGQLPQRNGSGKTSSTNAHMILLQQPNLLLATLQLHKPSSWKSGVTEKKMNGTYLPILNSYPRIAPHPSKKTPDKSSSNNESQNLSKRVCTEHKNDDTLVNLAEQHLNKQPKLAVLTSGLPHSPSARDSQSSSSSMMVSSSWGSTSGSSISTRALHRHGSSSSSGSSSIRHRRFLNTVDILRQSGLLDITLRTKELLRQSNTTERDIAQLRQHTELLYQAASNPTCSLNGLTAWEHVHQTMAESGSYPNLKILQNVQIQEPPIFSTGDTKGPLSAESSEGPPSHFFATIPEPNQTCPVPQQSHSGQGRELEAGFKSSEKVTFMPPDSSTG